MKKTMIAIILAGFFAIACGQVWAQEPQKIGVAAAVTGFVQTGAGKTHKTIKSGMDLFLNDRIRTGKNGSLQILLLDETVFTLGPGSDMVLDEFVYDPATDKGQVSAKMAKGIFRFITGKVARKDPSKMKVKVNAGTIGVRGTIVAGKTGPEGSTVILAGPGAKNNAGERPGAISVNGEGDNAKEVYIDVPGKGTTISPNGIVSKPSMMTQELAGINSSIDNAMQGMNSNKKGDNKENGSGSVNENEIEEDDDVSGQGEANVKEEAGEQSSNLANNGEMADNAAFTSSEDSLQNYANNQIVVPISWKDMARSFHGKAQYNVNSTISGIDHNGNPIGPRALAFGATLNMKDNALTDFYVKLDNRETIYNSNPVIIDINSNDNAAATFNYIYINSNGYNNPNSDFIDDLDLILNATLNFYEMPNGIYPRSTAEMVFISTTDLLTGLSLNGTYDINGRNYDYYNRPLTIGDMKRFAANHASMATFKAQGTLFPENNDTGNAYTHINANLTANVNFANYTLNDTVLELKAAGNGDTEDISRTYYQYSPVDIRKPNNLNDYNLTDKLSVKNEIIWRDYGDDDGNIMIEAGDIYIAGTDNAPILKLDDMRASITNNGYYSSNSPIVGLIQTDYNDALTLHELTRLTADSNNSITGSRANAKYTVNSLSLLDAQSTPTSYTADFDTTVNFGTMELYNTSIKIHESATDTVNFTQNNNIIIKPERTFNNNSRAQASLSSDNLETNNSGHISGAIYFNYSGTEAELPLMDLTLTYHPTSSPYPSYLVYATNIAGISQPYELGQLFPILHEELNNYNGIQLKQADYTLSGVLHSAGQTEPKDITMNVHVDFLRSKISAEANVGEEILRPDDISEIIKYTEDTEVYFQLTGNSSNPTKLNAAISFNEDENNLGVPSITAVLSYTGSTNNEPAAIMQSAAQNVTSAMLEQMTAGDFASLKDNLSLNPSAIYHWNRANILSSSNLDSIYSNESYMVLNSDDYITLYLSYGIDEIEVHSTINQITSPGITEIIFHPNDSDTETAGIGSFSFLGNASTPELLVNLNVQDKTATILHTDLTASN